MLSIDPLNSVITLIVGFIAFGVYWAQRRDFKKDAANTLLLEIQNAERQLKRAKETLNLDPPYINHDILTMPTESWSKYKYLFVRNFDRDEWDIITEFYNKCQQYDEAVKADISYFQKNEEQIRVNMQRGVADYAKEYAIKISTEKESEERQKLLNEFILLKNEFWELCLQNAKEYSPIKPVNDGKKIIENLSINTSQASIGIKLKKSARLKE